MAYNSKFSGSEIDAAIEDVRDGTLVTKANADNTYVAKSGTTMTGVLKAVSNANPTVSQVRNIYFGTTEMEDGVTALETGTIYIQYKP